MEVVNEFIEHSSYIIMNSKSIFTFKLRFFFIFGETIEQ